MITLAHVLLGDTSHATAAIRAWLPGARRVELSADDLARIDSYGSRDGATLHAELPLVLPLAAPVWYETEVVAQHGTRMRLGYGATPAGPGEIGVWFAARADGAAHLVGPLGPMRLDSTAIDNTLDLAGPGARELRSAAGIVIRALLLGLGGAQ